MGLPRISYNAGAGVVNLDFVRGPVGFVCRPKARVHDNVAGSGLRERVEEGQDWLISFTMPSLVVGEDFDEWDAFMAFALGGGSWDFYPNFGVFPAVHFHCISDDEAFEYQRVGVKRYSASFNWRIVPDAAKPASCADVMEAYYGIP